MVRVTCERKYESRGTKVYPENLRRADARNYVFLRQPPSLGTGVLITHNKRAYIVASDTFWLPIEIFCSYAGHASDCNKRNRYLKVDSSKSRGGFYEKASGYIEIQ